MKKLKGTVLGCLIRFKHGCPWIWRMVEECNGPLFGLRYGKIEKKAKALLDDVRETYAHRAVSSCQCILSSGRYSDESSGMCETVYRFALVEREDIAELSQLLINADGRYIENFHPHAFDEKTLWRLHRNPSFLMMKVTDEDTGLIVGYFFLRCFVTGVSYHGLFVNTSHTGRGIGTRMWGIGAAICRAIGLHMRATIADSNLASRRSLTKACKVSHKEPLSNGVNCYHIDAL